MRVPRAFRPRHPLADGAHKDSEALDAESEPPVSSCGQSFDPDPWDVAVEEPDDPLEPDLAHAFPTPSPPTTRALVARLATITRRIFDIRSITSFVVGLMGRPESTDRA